MNPDFYLLYRKARNGSSSRYDHPGSQRVTARCTLVSREVDEIRRKYQNIIKLHKANTMFKQLAWTVVIVRAGTGCT